MHAMELSEASTDGPDLPRRGKRLKASITFVVPSPTGRRMHEAINREFEAPANSAGTFAHVPASFPHEAE
jgi:hypothetical protein